MSAAETSTNEPASKPWHKAPSGQPPVELEHTTSEMKPRVEINLHPVAWTGDRDMATDVESVALDVSVVGTGDSNDGRDGAGYRIFADFDSGTVRLWQVRS